MQASPGPQKEKWLDDFQFLENAVNEWTIRLLEVVDQQRDLIERARPYEPAPGSGGRADGLAGVGQPRMALIGQRSPQNRHSQTSTPRSTRCGSSDTAKGPRVRFELSRVHMRHNYP